MDIIKKKRTEKYIKKVVNKNNELILMIKNIYQNEIKNNLITYPDVNKKLCNLDKFSIFDNNNINDDLSTINIIDWKCIKNYFKKNIDILDKFISCDDFTLIQDKLLNSIDEEKKIINKNKNTIKLNNINLHNLDINLNNKLNEENTILKNELLRINNKIKDSNCILFDNLYNSFDEKNKLIELNKELSLKLKNITIKYQEFQNKNINDRLNVKKEIDDQKKNLKNFNNKIKKLNDTNNEIKLEISILENNLKNNLDNSKDNGSENIYKIKKKLLNLKQEINENEKNKELLSKEFQKTNEKPKTIKSGNDEFLNIKRLKLELENKINSNKIEINNFEKKKFKILYQQHMDRLHLLNTQYDNANNRINKVFERSLIDKEDKIKLFTSQNEELESMIKYSINIINLKNEELLDNEEIFEESNKNILNLNNNFKKINSYIEIIIKNKEEINNLK